MQIREAHIKDVEGIKNLYLQAFDNSEAELVSNLAINLLHEKSAIKIISLVAIDNKSIIGHVAFSPVLLKSINAHFSYILAPLAVLPTYQQKGIGSTIVKSGLDTICSLGALIVFVYGDPRYYSRFGFKTELAQHFSPPHTLKYPEGWQAMKLNSTVVPGGGKLKCINLLDNPRLW
ncbi:MAG: N-acetyltransferase [Cyanobacteria bacterium P01_C01_bin.72]